MAWRRTRRARSKHSGGVNAAMGDGSVRFVTDTVDLRVSARHRDAGRRGGGEPAMKRTLNASFGAAVLLLLVGGCNGNTASVSGTVSYDGQAVGSGEINFLPADGVGPSGGGPITAGHFSVTGLTPGPKIVQVIAVKAVPFARSTEEMARRAAENKAKGDGSGLIDPADTIPKDAEGNNARHVITPGTQTLDLKLKKPAGRKG